jgi:hypothetical protein
MEWFSEFSLIDLGEKGNLVVNRVMMRLAERKSIKKSDNLAHLKTTNR